MPNIYSLHITPEILAMIAELDEFKGTWRALGLLAPEKLTGLKHVATIESVGSSTRIEGSKLTDAEVEALLSNLQIKEFGSRDEQEVAGYAEVMNLVFYNYEHIPFTENYIMQLHSELLRYSEKDDWHRGQYKKAPNNVVAFDKDGNSLGVVFETAGAFETPAKMSELVSRAAGMYENKTLHPLLVTAMFIVEFLAIHPFQDGNGRLSRVLTTYLLIKYGYVYVPYSSLEAVIEQNKEGYYLALRQTQGTLKNEQPDWQPWVVYFLRALVKQKNKLAQKIEIEKLLLNKLPELAQQILTMVTQRGRITINEVVTLTGGNRNTIKKHLETLVADNYLQKHGVTKGAWYTLKVLSV